MALMSIADARAHLGDVIGRVRHAGERVTLTSRGRRAVVIVPVSDLEALEAMERAADIRLAKEAVADIEAGREKTIPHAAVVAAIRGKSKGQAVAKGTVTGKRR